MYHKCDDAKADDTEIAALVEKARGAFSAVRNVDWLEWGSDLMPEMWESIAEEERQAEIERRGRDHSERLLLFKARVEARLARRAELQTNMMKPGVDLERMEGEFYEIDKAEKADEATERELEREGDELVRLVQGPSAGEDIDMEDETAVTQGKETEGESEKEDDEGEDGESATSKRMPRQSVYVAVPPMKGAGKSATGDRGPVSTEFCNSYLYFTFCSVRQLPSIEEDFLRRYVRETMHLVRESEAKMRMDESGGLGDVCGSKGGKGASGAEIGCIVLTMPLDCAHDSVQSKRSR